MARGPTVEQVQALNDRSWRLRERSLIARLDARHLLNRIARWQRESAAAQGGQGDSAERRSRNPLHRRNAD